jgi:predicted GNAT family N-acyltransferase
MSNVTVRPADWHTEEIRIRAVRIAVFTAEQGISEALDFDGRDPDSHHVLAVSPAGNAIGTGRIQTGGHIGRIAVLRPWRGQGVGTHILSALEQAAKTCGIKQVYLNAQAQAIRFYEKQGYFAVSKEFIEAGLPHRKMTKQLPTR